METYSFQMGIKIGKKELGNQNTYDRLFSTDEMLCIPGHLRSGRDVRFIPG